MKANELTEGIYVYFNCFDGSKITVKVTGFNDGIVYGVSEHGAHWCQISKIEPIPLTPEILEKNGFCGGEYKHYCGYVWHLKLEGFREIGFTYSNEKGVLWGEKIKSNYPTSIGDKFVIPNITYLHVLQHALRLCDILKEIEL